ncbi:hypothetical protein ACFL0V_04895 [Nanoarchaeota archaeon]
MEKSNVSKLFFIVGFLLLIITLVFASGCSNKPEVRKFESETLAKPISKANPYPKCNTTECLKSNMALCERSLLQTADLRDFSRSTVKFSGEIRVEGKVGDECEIFYRVDAPGKLAGKEMLCALPMDRADDFYMLLLNEKVARMVCKGSLIDMMRDFCWFADLQTDDQNKIDLCYVMVAGIKKDKEHCDSVLNETTRSICLETVQTQEDLESRVKGNDESACSDPSMGLLHQDDCYKRIAIATKNVDLCKETLLWKTGNCVVEVAIKLNDESVCEVLEKDVFREGCKEDVKAFREGEDYCENKEDVDERNACLIGLAGYGDDPSFCAKIEGGEDEGVVRDLCYVALATRTKNPSICPKIGRLESRATCVSIMEV